MLPNFWRQEIWHPLTVHLPVTVLSLAAAFRIGHGLLARRHPGLAFLDPAARLLLLIGVAGAWVAVYTGNLAHDVVNRTLCDPEAVFAHEEWAERASILFSIAAALDLLLWRLRTIPRRRLAELFQYAVLAAATALLIQAGHLGASLVYQQGAGVYHPSAECTEFE